MGQISITDALGVEIVSANPQLTSGFGKYFKGQAAALLAGIDVASQLRAPLHLANAGDSGLRLAWKDAVPLGGDDVTLTIEAGAQATIGVFNRTGMVLVGGTFLGPPVKVGAGRRLRVVHLASDPGTRPEREGWRPHVRLHRRLLVGAAVCRPLRSHRRPAFARRRHQTVFEHFVIPNTADDLREMKDLPAGTLACVSGNGELQIGASVDVAAAFNPLASVSRCRSSAR